MLHLPTLICLIATSCASDNLPCLHAEALIRAEADMAGRCEQATSRCLPRANEARRAD